MIKNRLILTGIFIEMGVIEIEYELNKINVFTKSDEEPLNVGTIAMSKILGEKYGSFFGLAISLLLISGISAMVWVGSRVTSSIAKDYKFWHFFKVKGNNLPKRALWFQFGISTLLILTGSFEQILIYCGVLLTISSTVTVFGVFKLRKQNRNNINKGFKSPLFPLFQIIFIALSLWMIIYAFINKPTETLIGFTNIALGFITFLWSNKLNNKLKFRSKLSGIFIWTF